LIKIKTAKMKAKFVNEDTKSIFKPKSLDLIKADLIDKINNLILDHTIFKYNKNQYIGSGAGKILALNFWKNFPSLVNASDEFYSCTSQDTFTHNNPMYYILLHWYGITNLNMNKMLGDTINVPVIQKWVSISDKINSMFAILKSQKIILQYYRETNGLCFAEFPNVIYFDYNHLKTINNI
jgi:hypothetical protein